MLINRKPTKCKPTIERLMAKVNQNGPVPEQRPELGPCWVWTASCKGNGRPQFNAWGRTSLAHRVAYMILKGKIPRHLELDHLCRNIKCVNPDHLEAVTRRVNLLRSPISLATVNANKTHCPAGHPYSKSNTYYTAEHKRQCRICKLATNAAYALKQKLKL